MDEIEEVGRERGVWTKLLDAVIEQKYSENEMRFGYIAINRTYMARKREGASSALMVTRR